MRLSAPASHPIMSRRRPARLFARLGVVLAALVWAAALAASEPARTFHVPAGDAVETLKLAARQGGLEIVFFAETVHGVRTPALHGDLSPRDAFERLLAGTGLMLVADENGGPLTIRRAPRASGTADSPATPASLPPSPPPMNLRGIVGKGGTSSGSSGFTKRGVIRTINSVRVDRSALLLNSTPMIGSWRRIGTAA